MSDRRAFLSASLRLAAAGAACGLPAHVLAANRAAFEARTVADVVKAYGGSGTLVDSREVSVQAPEIAEDGAVVPVSVASAARGVRHLLLLAERNPSLLVARFEVSDAVEAAFATRMKLSETSPVLAVAILQDGRALVARREVKVTLGGCLGPSGAAVVATPASEPARIRAQAGAQATVVRVLLQHEMESGQRRDAGGRVVPAWHITDVTASLNGKPAFAAEWGPGVSRNPFLQFQLKAAKAGDKLALQWRDTRGAGRSDEATVA